VQQILHPAVCGTDSVSDSVIQDFAFSDPKIIS